MTCVYKSCVFILLLFVSLVVTASDQASEVTEFENGLISRWEFGKDNPKRWTIEERLKAHDVPGVAVGIIQQGKIIHAKGYGNKQVGQEKPVNAQTLFSVGSVSKMVNAALVLKLVESGKLSLDTDVNQFLTSWKVPNSRHTKDNAPTLRQILSHTAGFNVHGFPDFQPGAKLPTVLDTLTGRHPARHRAIKVIFEPGSEMDYSGGGITVSQLAVTDSLKMSYVDASRQFVFEPLGMNRSTFLNPLPPKTPNVAHAHNEDGKPATDISGKNGRGWEAMPEMAASGLWTNADDLTTFVIALINSYQTEDGFLKQSLARDMMDREVNSWYGLGPRINGNGKTLVFHHGGANNSYRAWVEGHLGTGDGIVILTNGTNGHFVHQEIRRAAQDAFNWDIKSDGGFEEPDL